MSSVPHMPEEPTMADIARHLVALHDCVHEGQAQQANDTAAVAEALREHRHESRNNAQKVQAQLADMHGRVSYTEGALKIISKTIGAPPPAPPGVPAPTIKKRIASLQPWQAGLGLIAAIAGATGGYRILVAAAEAFHAAMMAGS